MRITDACSRRVPLRTRIAQWSVSYLTTRRQLVSDTERQIFGARPGDAQ
jgi:hypothetical protein